MSAREKLLAWINATPGKREEFEKGWWRPIEQYLNEYRYVSDIELRVAEDLEAPDELIAEPERLTKPHREAPQDASAASEV